MDIYSDVQNELANALSELQDFDQRHTLGNTISNKEEQHLNNAKDELKKASNKADDEKASRELDQRSSELDQAIQMLKEHPSETDDIHLTYYDFIQVTIEWLEDSVSN